MLNIIVCIILLIITGVSLYTVDKLFEKNIVINPTGTSESESLNILSDYIIILSMDGCPYCKILESEYISKTDKKHTIITYNNKQKNFNFDTYFLEIPSEERENIIDNIDKYLKGPTIFPSIIYKNKITKGLADKSILKTIFS
jgi:glutaredoxin